MVKLGNIRVKWQEDASALKQDDNNDINLLCVLDDPFYGTAEFNLPFQGSFGIKSHAILVVSVDGIFWGVEQGWEGI